MLRTASSLPLTGLLTLGSDAGRFPPTPPACYRASWQLPGPDFHRQATTSLRTARFRCYITASPPALLGARKPEVNPTKILAMYETHYNGRRPHRSRQLRPPRPTTPSRTCHGSGSSAGPSSAASSARTSGPYRSPGQGWWPSSGTPQGRGWVRRSTATSCRSTKSSASLEADDRPSRTSQPQSRTKMR